MQKYSLSYSKLTPFCSTIRTIVIDLIATRDDTLYQGHCGSLSCYDEAYKAQIHVAFGLPWACSTTRINSKSNNNFESKSNSNNSKLSENKIWCDL